VYLNLPKMHMRGVTAEASYKLAEDWTLYGNYSYQKAILDGNVATFGDGTFPTEGKTFLNTPKNSAYVRLGYDHGPFWASLDTKYRGPIWGDWSNTEQVGGYTTFNLSAGWKFSDFATWLRNPYIKLNVFNLTDKRALTNANNIGAFLASNPGNKIRDVNTGGTLFTSAPYYSLLEDRTYMVTFGISFF